MRVTVYGPNLPASLSAKGTLVVHRHGCADTRRGVYTRLGADQGGWTIEAETIADIVTDIYPPGHFEYEGPSDPDYGTYRHDVHVFPCVDLPEEAA